MYTFKPGKRRNLLRKPSNTLAMGSRSLLGLRLMNMRPLLIKLPLLVAPAADTMLNTLGSFFTISAAWSCSANMAVNEMSSAASVVTEIWPMSSSGKKPLGTQMYMAIVTTNVPNATHNTWRGWRKHQSKLVSYLLSTA